MKKHVVALILVMIMLTSAIPCAYAQDAGEPLPMRWILPGMAKGDSEMVQEAMYEALKADGLNIKPEFIYYGWDVWQQKSNVILAAGEPFELMNTMENGSPSTTTLMSKKAILPLDDLIKEYGQDMYNLFPESVWQQATINGSIMSIPAPWIDLKAVDYLSMRKDKLDKYGLSVPTTFDELLEATKVIAAGEVEETGLNWYINLRANSNSGLNVTLQRGIDGFPFYIWEQMTITYEDGTVASYLESPQFKAWCEFTYEANQAGLIYPDLLGADLAFYDDLATRGIFLASERNFAGEARLREQYDPNAEVINFMLAPDQPSVRFNNYNNCNTVSASSPNPEAAVMFMNWLYKDQAHMDLLLLGIEGVHWNDEGDRAYSLTEYNFAGGTPQSEYGFANWMVNWAPYQRFDVATRWEQSAEIEYTFDDTTKNLVTTGFVFTPDAVASEYANCLSIITLYINPISLGFQSYDEAFPSALSRMKDAGFDLVLEEYKAQFEAFLATKG